MREIDLTKKQPSSLGDDYLVFEVGEEESICVNCNLPAEKCNGECKRYRAEMKKLRESGHCKPKNIPCL